MRSHTQSVVIELNRRRITVSISYKPLISDISVLIVCNKTGGTIKGDKKISISTNTYRIRTELVSKLLSPRANYTDTAAAAGRPS